MKLSDLEKDVIKRMRTGVQMEIIRGYVYLLDRYQQIGSPTIKSLKKNNLIEKGLAFYTLTPLGRTIEI
jgi:predicted transcriptional regulator